MGNSLSASLKVFDISTYDRPHKPRVWTAKKAGITYLGHNADSPVNAYMRGRDQTQEAVCLLPDLHKH